jgi:phosphoribosyl 1,2-cyclic phosphodiesterase
MQVRFWGVRGSVPWATPAAIGHGCNTPCLELRDERTGARLILDAGSGIVGLGPVLDHAPRDLPIVLTHYHWDHLQGLPFLAQLYAPGWKPRIYAPRTETTTMEWVSTIFSSPFFPVPYERLPNKPDVDMILPGALTLGGFQMTSIPLNHPGGAFAYRVKGANGDLVYATDHEFGDPNFDEPLAEFAKGAAGVILDAHFTPDEIPQYRGWGHSDWRTCAEFASRIGAGKLWLFHHKPGRTDEELIGIRAEARAVFAPTETAAEGDILAF